VGENRLTTIMYLQLFEASLVLQRKAEELLSVVGEANGAELNDALRHEAGQLLRRARSLQGELRCTE